MPTSDPLPQPAMGECAHLLSAPVSPFPSPSSSFLTPPTPGAHEFALRPVPSVRSLRSPSPPHTPRPLSSASLLSSRPAPPSPAASLSRANSLRHPSSPGARAEGPPQSHSRSFSSSSLALPADMGLSPSSPAGSSRSEHKVFIKIRDFAFQPTDERHNGQGPFVPKPNRVGRMNRRLGGRPYSTSSISSDDADDDDESDGWGSNPGGNGFGYGGGWVGGRFSWAVSSGAGASTAATIFDQEKAYAAAAANLSAAASKTNGKPDDDDRYPSRSEMDRNFLDSESDEFYDAEDNYEGSSGLEDDDDEPLYPGLYRALYAFDPEGTAEMRLVEDQIVRVVGRGGGVGWAVVVADGTELMDSDAALKTTNHALVPESYLEPYKLDWEHDEAVAADTNNRRTA